MFSINNTFFWRRCTSLTRKECRDIHTKDKGDNEDDDDLEQPFKPQKKRTAGPQATSVLLPLDKCIVCDQRRKYVPHLKQYEYKLVKCETKEAEKSIREAAVEKQNFSVLGRIEGLDLVAREAYYHERCRRELVRDIKRHQGRDASFSRRNEAHREAMEHVCQYIEENIIQKAQVERMTMILERFLGYLQQHAPEHYNPNYRTLKLKEKLIHHFGERIKFWSPNSRSDLIYSSELLLGQAVELAFVAAASESRRRVVLDAFRERDPDPWSPTAESLLSAHSSVGPEALAAFLKTLLCGKKTKGESQNRVASSVAQDICYSLSNGRWKQPKHIALAMTVRHLTGNAELISIMNHLGHCLSHVSVLKIENAIYRRVFFSSKIIPPSIFKNRQCCVAFCLG